MTPIHMIREPDLEVINPTLVDVRSLIAKVANDDGEPVIILKTTILDGELTSVNELWIVRLNECNAGTLAGWLVRCKTSRSKHSFVLASQVPFEETFGAYELLGAIQQVRRECLVNEGNLGEAIQWFLLNGVQNPSLTWLDFQDGVRTL